MVVLLVYFTNYQIQYLSSISLVLYLVSYGHDVVIGCWIHGENI